MSFQETRGKSSTEIPMTFMLFLIINTGTSLYLGIQTDALLQDNDKQDDPLEFARMCTRPLRIFYLNRVVCGLIPGFIAPLQ